MLNHEYFRELSALAAIGQLSSSEEKALSLHLADCDICCSLHQEYSHIIQHQLPKITTASEKPHGTGLRLPPDSQIRDRFLARARAEGIDFSLSAENPSSAVTPDRVSSRSRLIMMLSAAAAIIISIAIFMDLMVQKHDLIERSKFDEMSVEDKQKENLLQVQLANLRQLVEREKLQLADLHDRDSISAVSIRDSERRLQQAYGEAEVLSGAIAKANSEKLALGNANEQKDSLITTLREQNDQLGRQNADYLSDLVIEKEQLQELSQSLRQTSASLEQERELMSAATDVRRLMGARNLHIMDVRDVDVENKSAKSFGRVFYAEGQSLIFYAFDLPSERTSSRYSFHAWGGREADSRSPRNLGTFEVDDHEQRRWVLKVNDPSLLAGIESVFVTAESLKDVREPRGRKLLYAFIAGQPNHP